MTKGPTGGEKRKTDARKRRPVQQKRELGIVERGGRTQLAWRKEGSGEKEWEKRYKKGSEKILTKRRKEILRSKGGGSTKAKKRSVNKRNNKETKISTDGL